MFFYGTAAVDAKNADEALAKDTIVIGLLPDTFDLLDSMMVMSTSMFIIYMGPIWSVVLL